MDFYYNYYYYCYIIQLISSEKRHSALWTYSIAFIPCRLLSTWLPLKTLMACSILSGAKAKFFFTSTKRLWSHRCLPANFYAAAPKLEYLNHSGAIKSSFTVWMQIEMHLQFYILFILFGFKRLTEEEDNFFWQISRQCPVSVHWGQEAEV